MDITLERILSLLPKKPNGNFVQGAKKDFATKIGYESGDIVSMWINGTSSSYKGKVHKIASVYNVSVEWLLGESDQKEKPLTGAGEGLSEAKRILIEKIRSMDDATIDALNQIADQVLSLRGK